MKLKFLLSLYHHWFCVIFSYLYITSIPDVLFVLDCTFPKDFGITFYLLDNHLFSFFFFFISLLIRLFVLLFSFCTSEYLLPLHTFHSLNFLNISHNFCFFLILDQSLLFIDRFLFNFHLDTARPLNSSWDIFFYCFLEFISKSTPHIIYVTLPNTPSNIIYFFIYVNFLFQFPFL